MAQSNGSSGDAFPEVINLTVKQGIKEIGVFELDPRIFTVRELKMIIEDASNVLEINQRLVYGGKVLRDESLLVEFLKPGNPEATIFLSRANGMKGEGPRRPATAPVASKSPSERFKALSPIASMMSKNPELLEKMFLANPQFQKMAEKNPQIKHALSDPSTLKTIFEMSTNPKVYKEVMRGHDRALSNLENIPQGFQHLVRLQKSMDNADRGQMHKKVNTQIDASNSATRNQLTSEPFPNPWVSDGIPLYDPRMARSKVLQKMAQEPSLDEIMERALILENGNTEEPNDPDRSPDELRLLKDPQSTSEYEDAMEVSSSYDEEAEPDYIGMTFEFPMGTPLKCINMKDPMIKFAFSGTEIIDNLDKYEAQYKKELEEMEKMGCDDKIMNIRTLVYTNGDLDQCIEWNLNGKFPTKDHKHDNANDNDDEINRRRH